MILDNKNENQKVFEWLKEYTESGKIDIVTGYFTVGALAYLSRQINNKIKNFRMVLGDIVNIDMIQDRTIDLLNENITIEAALKLSAIAKESVEFLKQEKVETKTLEPNFCHAKIYLFNPEQDDRHKYFVSGSSNLTEAGIGLKETNNIELNIAETGNNNQYQELKKWFNDLWKSKEAHKTKTIIDETGKKHTTDNTGILCNHSIVVFKRFIDLKKVQNRSISVSISKNNIKGKGSNTKTQVANRRNELERISSVYSLRYVLAVINSKYAIAHLNNFRKHRLKNYFYPDDFRNFPIPNLSQQKQYFFVFIVNVILLLNKVNRDTILFKSAIDGMVFEFYFPDHMTERKIDILQFVEKDIEEVMQGKEFETLSDTQKERVIAELHNRWSDSNSEIVKRMNSFSEKSPEILKPILEG